MPLKKHPMVNWPTGNVTKLLRLGANGGWWTIKTPSDARPAHAFVGLLDGEPTAWVRDCSCKVHAKCPASTALAQACNLWGHATLLRIDKFGHAS